MSQLPMKISYIIISTAITLHGYQWKITIFHNYHEYELHFTAIAMNNKYVSQLQVKIDCISQLPTKINCISQLPTKINCISQLPTKISYISPLPMNNNCFTETSEDQLHFPATKEDQLHFTITSKFHLYQWWVAYFIDSINLREDRRGNQKWTIQKNWQHRVRKNQSKNTTQYALDTTMRKQKQIY